MITRFAAENAAANPPAPPEKGVAKESDRPGNVGVSAAIPDRYVAYVFDNIPLRFIGLATAREAAIKDFTSTLRPTDRAAVFSTSGQTMRDFSDDRAALRATLLRLIPHPISSAGSASTVRA